MILKTFTQEDINKYIETNRINFNSDIEFIDDLNEKAYSTEDYNEQRFYSRIIGYLKEKNFAQFYGFQHLYWVPYHKTIKTTYRRRSTNIF